jgi:hypothetical protein
VRLRSPKIRGEFRMGPAARLWWLSTAVMATGVADTFASWVGYAQTGPQRPLFPMTARSRRAPILVESDHPIGPASATLS